jgi:hypothetical protein
MSGIDAGEKDFCLPPKAAAAGRNIRASRAPGVSAIFHRAGGVPGKGVLATSMPCPSLLDIAISVSEAREALFAYERWMFCARSEIRETAARMRETIAQSRALMAQADAIATADEWGP